MKKIILTIPLCGALLFGIAGCGEKNNVNSLNYANEKSPKLGLIKINNHKTDDELRKIILRKAHILSKNKVWWNIDKRYYGNENGKDYYMFSFIYEDHVYEYIISQDDGSILSHNNHPFAPNNSFNGGKL